MMLHSPLIKMPKKTRNLFLNNDTIPAMARRHADIIKITATTSSMNGGLLIWKYSKRVSIPIDNRHITAYTHQYFKNFPAILYKY